MRVLIGCECSGVVREAFRALGHDAYSCDLKPSEDRSEFHYRCDVQRTIAWGGWDLVIFHPDCTLFNNASAWAIPDPDFVRFPDAQRAAESFGQWKWNHHFGYRLPEEIEGCITHLVQRLSLMLVSSPDTL